MRTALELVLDSLHIIDINAKFMGSENDKQRSNRALKGDFSFSREATIASRRPASVMPL